MAIGRSKYRTKFFNLIILFVVIFCLRLFFQSLKSTSTNYQTGIILETNYYPVDETESYFPHDTAKNDDDNEEEEEISIEVIVVDSDDFENKENIPQQTTKAQQTSVSSLHNPAKPSSQEIRTVMSETLDDTSKTTYSSSSTANVIKATLAETRSPDTNRTQSPVIDLELGGENLTTKAEYSVPSILNETIDTTVKESRHRDGHLKTTKIKDTVPPTQNVSTVDNSINISKKETKPTDSLDLIPKASNKTDADNVFELSIGTIKPTNTSNTIVVTDKTENVVVFTKEQLEYGDFVKSEVNKQTSTVKDDTPTVNTTPNRSDNTESLKSKHTASQTTQLSYTARPMDLYDGPSNVAVFREVPLDEARLVGHCQRVIPWGQTYHAKISTFGLQKKGNYTIIDKMGNYPLPVKTVAEVTDPKTLKPVTVILVPFSHADPGYGLTIEQYYKSKTHSTLDNMITKLLEYPNLTFQWAETVYLARWFQDLSDDKKKQVRQLIDRGQLEIVLGGWVMPDEASSRYVGVVDQLIEGHQWLVENLGVKPKNAWVNDPFGYSSTMPYLWKSTGMDNLVFLRINQAVKAQLMKIKSMDFKWRPYWKTDNSSDVLSSLMAYTNYWIGDVCSPDRDTCNEFGFIHLDEKKHRAIEITEGNLEKQAEKLHGMFRVTADLYKYNTLYIGLGEDFTYVRAAEWDNLYKNYEKLIHYINAKSEWKMEIKFGNLTDYFNHVKKMELEKLDKSGGSLSSSDAIPTLSGDFFPYTEKNKEYWTGYYTTRPLNKRFSRELESLVHAADVFNVMLFSIFKYYNVKYDAYTTVAENLRIARREVGMFLHHDGITGTSLPHVVRDFEWRLMKAYESVQTACKTIITTMLTKGTFHYPKLLKEEIIKSGPRQVAQKIILQVDGEEKRLVLVNPTGKQRSEFVSVYVNTMNVNVKSAKIPLVQYQTSNMNGRILVTFRTELPAYGIEIYKIVPSNTQTPANLVQERSSDDVLFGTEDTIAIENMYMKVILEKSSGMLKHAIYKNGNTVDIKSEFLAYRTVNSGAYIFGPYGNAVPFSTGKKVVTVTKGPLMSEVKVKFPGFMFSTTLYNISGLQGQGIHIKTEVNLAVIRSKDTEAIVRFCTSIKSGQNFFTDQNGFQLMGRQTDYDSKPDANYYPMTTMVVMEDKFKRFTLHSKQPHGVASLEGGHVEVMLDRKMRRDDGRGLGQGIYDNVNVNSDFILQFEMKEKPSKLDEVRYTYPTQDAHLMNDALQNSLLIYSVVDNNVKISDKIHPLKDRQLPCDVTIVGLRNLVKNNLEYNGTSLVLHRHSFQCGYESYGDCKGMDGKLTIKSLFPKLKVGVTETSLSHLHLIKECDMNTDLIPSPMELRSFRIDI